MNDAPSSPAPGKAAAPAMRAAGQGLLDLVRSLLGTLVYLRARAKRRPAPRIGLMGPVEGVALAALAVGLVAASMILLDPLVLGVRQRLPQGLVTLAERITDLGLGSVMLWPLGLAILYLLALSPRLDDMGRRVAASVVARAGFLFLSIATVGLSVSIVKNLLGRARPYAAAVIGGPDSQLTFHWLAWKSSFASFPSGHSTTVFATAVAFGVLFPRARRLLLLLAVVVASTRVLLGSHYPSDVVAGAAIGTAFVLLMEKVFAWRRVVFAVEADGRVRPMAGPSARRIGHVLAPRRHSSTQAEAGAHNDNASGQDAGTVPPPSGTRASPAAGPILKEARP